MGEYQDSAPEGGGRDGDSNSQDSHIKTQRKSPGDGDTDNNSLKNIAAQSNQGMSGTGDKAVGGKDKCSQKIVCTEAADIQCAIPDYLGFSAGQYAHKLRREADGCQEQGNTDYERKSNPFFQAGEGALIFSGADILARHDRHGSRHCGAGKHRNVIEFTGQLSGCGSRVTILVDQSRQKHEGYG